MNILPVSCLLNINKNPNINKTANSNNVLSNYTVSKPMQADTVSFGRTAKNAKILRSWFKYGMIDIHTGQQLIDPELFEYYKQTRLFNRSIKNIVKEIKPLQECLHTTESEVFYLLDECSKKYPQIKLSDAMQLLSIQALHKLLKVQEPIFKELENEARELPPSQLQAFNELLSRTRAQLSNKPILYRFSKKDFFYKLGKISQKIEKGGNKEEIKSMRHIRDMVQKIPYTPSGRNFNNKDINISENVRRRQASLFRDISSYFYRSALCDNKELEFLMSMIKQELFDIPVKVPFSRKAFLHDLDNILCTLKNKKYAHRLAKIAKQLPTSQEESAAFIVKHSRSSSEDIGHSLLVGQVGVIDHIEAFSAGGEDAVENYAFTSVGFNSLRSNMPMKKWLDVNPQTYIGAQMSVNRIVDLVNEGKIRNSGYAKHYIESFAKKMRQNSPSEEPLIIDTSGIFVSQKELNPF